MMVVRLLIPLFVLAAALCLGGCMQYYGVAQPIDSADDPEDIPADPSTYAETCAAILPGACFSIPMGTRAGSYDYNDAVQCQETDDGVVITASDFQHLPAGVDQFTVLLDESPLVGDHLEELTLKWSIDNAASEMFGGPDCYLDIAHGMPHLVATFQCRNLSVEDECNCSWSEVDMVEGAIRCP